MKLAYLILILFPLLTACEKQRKSLGSTVTGTPSIVMTGKPLIIIMAGQSNMAGDPYSAANTGRVRYATPSGLGPVQYFAEAMIQKHQAINLIVINCAVHGTYISQWAPGGLIDDCLDVVRREQPNGVIGGFIFLQGEADAKYGEEPVGPTYDWAIAFTSMARYLRARLETNVPIVLAQINRTSLSQFPAWDHIKLEQSSVALDNLTHISTAGADLYDGIHYTQNGYMLVGRRMADALYGLYLG